MEKLKSASNPSTSSGCPSLLFVSFLDMLFLYFLDMVSLSNHKILIAMAALSLTACSEITSHTNAAPAPSSGETEIEGQQESPDLNHPKGNTAIVLGANFSDPNGTLNLLPILAPRTATQNVQTTHSDAVVRAFDNKIYVVNRYGADNIQVVNPANFGVTLQCSTGGSTNPQQIIVISATKAYVSLYQPESNNSLNLAVDDILVVNPSISNADCAASFTTKTVDLTPLTVDDGERLARASAMVLIGERLFVALQDLPGDFGAPNQPGKIAVIDTATDSVVGSMTLAGRNPFAMDYSQKTGLIYVTDANFTDSSSPFLGIEAVDPDTLETKGIFIDASLLGGSPADIEVGDSRGYATVGVTDPATFTFSTKVVSFNLDVSATPAVTELYRGQGFIQDIAVDENGLLLVGDQDPDVNGILFINPETGTVVDGPINMGLPPSSITFVDR